MNSIALVVLFVVGLLLVSATAIDRSEVQAQAQADLATQVVDTRAELLTHLDNYAHRILQMEKVADKARATVATPENVESLIEEMNSLSVNADDHPGAMAAYNLRNKEMDDLASNTDMSFNDRMNAMHDMADR